MGDKIETASARLVGARKGPKRVPAIAPARFPLGELEQLWAATHPVDDREHADVVDAAAAFYLARRAWSARALARLDLVRLMPLTTACSSPTWWPRPWARTWRMIARAYDARGNLASIAGVSIVPDTAPALRWPKRCTRRHVLADALGAAFLTNPAESGVDRVIVCEHFDDFVTMSIAVAEAGRSNAVLGVMPEAVPTVRGIRWPADVPIVIKSRSAASAAADDAYCVAVRDELPRSADLRRCKPNSQERAR